MAVRDVDEELNRHPKKKLALVPSLKKTLSTGITIMYYLHIKCGSTIYIALALVLIAII